MIPNQQMNANYSNQYFDSQTPAVSATSPYQPQPQNFNYQTKPTQYPTQPRFMPATSPQTAINTPMPQMIPNYQRPTPTSTPVSIPVQSPTSPSVSTFYPQYPQYSNQYQPVQYNQIMTTNQIMNQIPYQESPRFAHPVIQQPPIQHHMYQSQYQHKMPLSNRVNLVPPSPANINVQKNDNINTENLLSSNCTKINVNKCQPTPVPSAINIQANKLKNEPNEKEESFNKMICFLVNLPLTSEEEEILSDYDSRLYGFLKLDSYEQLFKKYFLLKVF